MADQEHVIGVPHDGRRDARWVLEAFKGSDGARAARGAVHHRRIQLHDAQSVRKAPVADARVSGIGLDESHTGQRRLQCIIA